jgi:hypothetical protein
MALQSRALYSSSAGQVVLTCNRSLKSSVTGSSEDVFKMANRF